jgi:hypothetical protein
MIKMAIDSEIRGKAERVLMPVNNSWMFEAQFLFWKTVKDLVDAGEINEVRRMVPGIEPEVIESLQECEPYQVRNLCMAEICTLKPALGSDFIVSILKNKSADRGVMALQLVSKNKKS